MKRKTPLLLAVILCLLAIIASVKVITKNGNTARDQTSENERGKSGKVSITDDTNGPTSTKSERADAAYKKALQEMEREFDEILPAQFPDLFSSLCDVNLNPGETLVHGGYKNAEGNFEFHLLRIESFEVDGSMQNFVSTGIFTMNGEKASESGLDPLLSLAKKRIQQSIVLPPGEISWSSSASYILSAPKISIKPGEIFADKFTYGKKPLGLSFITDPGSDGKSVRVRIRLESSTENWNQ